MRGKGKDFLTAGQRARLEELAGGREPDEAPGLTERVRREYYHPVKLPVSLRLDADVVAWLKADGRGYQTRANQILRERMVQELEGR